jgi:hypothetical protein
MRAKTFSSTRCSAKTAATFERPKARWVCGGGKSTSNPYDPQIGAAAGASAATAARAQQFSEDYYRDTIAPLLERTVASSEQQTAHLNELYDVNVGNLRQANERYTQYGIPAENRYYDMVDNYSTEDEYQRQAMTAKGDVAAAQQGQRGQMMRQYAALGIDPTSPAAVAAMRAGAVGDAAVEAGAMNRARNAARNLGMQLKSDAANFGRGGQSGILQFGAGAQGNATGAFGIAQGALGSAVQAGGAQQAGYQTALQGYGQNLGAYTSARQHRHERGAQQQSAMWSGLGAMAGMAFSRKAGDQRPSHEGKHRAGRHDPWRGAGLPVRLQAGVQGPGRPRLVRRRHGAGPAPHPASRCRLRT